MMFPSSSPDRRAFLAAGMASLAIPAAAGAAHALSQSSPLALAVARHDQAGAACEDCKETADAILDTLYKERFDALTGVARAPCASDAELVEKLRYLLKYEMALDEDKPDESLDFGSLLVACDLHFNSEQRS